MEAPIQTHLYTKQTLHQFFYVYENMKMPLFMFPFTYQNKLLYKKYIITEYTLYYVFTSVFTFLIKHQEKGNNRYRLFRYKKYMNRKLCTNFTTKEYYHLIQITSCKHVHFGRPKKHNGGINVLIYMSLRSTVYDL